jgi:hypothetical protein
MEINEYFALINECARTSKDLTIPNSEPKHAAYLIKTLFKNAEANIRIFTGHLFEGVFGDQDLQEEACKFLREDANHSIRIAYQARLDISNSTFIQTILNDKQTKGSLKVWDASEKYSNFKNHFAVMDDKAFRFEIDHDSTRAVANFGDQANASRLVAVFDKITKDYSPILEK